MADHAIPHQPARGLNALSGIGGVRTEGDRQRDGHRRVRVLMPCRALEAFGLNTGAYDNLAALIPS